jgi:glucokinase
MASIGIDIGGTKIAVGVLNGFEIVYSMRFDYVYSDNIPGLVAFLARLINNLSDDYPMESAGIGSPGWVVDGVVREAVNLGITELNMRAEVQALVRIPVHVENDARTALLGEFAMGSLKGCLNALMVTLGTGIGGAFLLDGRLYRGSFGCAGELGHVSLDTGGPRCSCGKNGCLELYASGISLASEARRIARENDGTLRRLCGGNINALDGEAVFHAADAGDADALKLLERYVDRLAHALLETAYLMDLDSIALGGGISAQEHTVIEPIRQ